MAKQEMKHLHLFPDSMPTDQIRTVVNMLRGIEDGKTRRDQVESAWWVAGYGLSFIPDSHPVMHGATPYTNEQAADQLEVAAGMHGDAVDAKAIPWALLVPIVLKLIERFLS